MRPDPWPSWLEDVWAKSPREQGEVKGESLASHTWSTLQKLAELARLRPSLADHTGCPALWNRLWWAVWLHDFGKAARSFQARLRGGPAWPHRHEVLSLAFTSWVSAELSQEDLRWVTAGIVSHHREADEISRLYPEPDDNEEPLNDLVAQMDEDTVRGLHRWLAACAGPWAQSLKMDRLGIRTPVLPDEDAAAAQVRQSGALAIREQLWSFRGWHRELRRSHEHALVVGTMALRGHMVWADHLASAHAPALQKGIVGPPNLLLTRLEISPDRLHQHQRQCAAASGSAVLIAPTGSGKTEAALLWASALEDDGYPPPRLFYTLPYQASMNAMYDRLREKAYPDQVGLEHSRSLLALYRRSLEADLPPIQATQAARWEKDLARLHYYPVRVLSPYQLLKAPYRLRGYEALLSDCFGSAFILDEVHAYEAGRLAMILSTVQYLREGYGARFLVMSATLPGLLQTRLREALGEHALIRATPDLFARFRRHRLRLAQGDLLSPEWLERIQSTAASGQSVLVCCNTVRRAQQAFAELERRLVGQTEVVLLHGRFNGRDRLRKEAQVRQASGVGSTSRRCITLVSTQVVEVSLNIDLDTIYTDPAPLEALIQRFGRVNRQGLRGIADVYVFSEPADGQGVYNHDLVQRSLGVLAARDGQELDEEGISDWLDEVYSGDIRLRWVREYEGSARDFAAGCLSSLRAFGSDDALEELFYQAFDAIDVLPACLESEYARLERDAPLAASELLVSMQYRQYRGLVSRGLMRTGEGTFGQLRIVDAPYDAVRGLQLG